MLDPTDLYRLETDTDVAGLRAATLVVALSGFLDAGHVQRLLTEHMLEHLDHRVVATFDVDALLDYRGRRPLMTYDVDRWTDYADPTLALYELHDDEGVPFLLLTGPEPDYQWERMTEAVQQLVRAFGVRHVVVVQGVPMATPHTRAVTSSFHGTDPQRRAEHTSAFGNVRMPGSLAALLELRLGEAGQDAFGYAIHVPHYLAQGDYPPAAVAGLEKLCESVGLSISDTALRAAGEETMQAVAAELDSSPEAATMIAALEARYDAIRAALDGDGPLLEEGASVPTAEEIGAEFEAFLAEQDRREGPRY